MKILKFKLGDNTDSTGIKEYITNLPIVYDILDFEIQRGCFCIWIASEYQSTREVKFRIYETGDEVVDGDKYIKTIHHTGWVWHLYRAENV